MTASLRAHISGAALEANVRQALGGVDDADAIADLRRDTVNRAVADLRRDAWGHGVDLVAPVLVAAGVRAARFDDGVTLPDGMTATHVEPTVDGELLFGLPGSGGIPVMRLSADVLSIKRLLAGEGVSYNYTHRAIADTRIALVAGGFGQGVLRGIGNSVDVEIAGARHAIVGRVAMDVCVVDIGSAEVSPGDEVVYFGGEGPARDNLADWAAATGLTGAELACALGLRVERALWIERSLAVTEDAS